MMDWQIKPLSKKCALSEEPFQEGEVVVSFVYKDEEGNLARADILESSAADWTPPSPALAKWSRTVKFISKEEKEDETQANQSAEDLFYSLYDNEAQADPQEQQAFKHILALMLEKKRLLKRIQDKSNKTTVTYFSPNTDSEYEVQLEQISPEFLDRVITQIDKIIN